MKNILLVIGQIATPVKGKRQGRRDVTKIKLFKILLDSGATGNLISERLVPKKVKTKIKRATCTTANGIFSASHTTDVAHSLPKFSLGKTIAQNFNVLKDSSLPRDMILGAGAL